MPDAGQIAYEAYVEAQARAGLEVDEGWHDLPRSDQDAWRAAADAVVALYEEVGQ